MPVQDYEVHPKTRRADGQKNGCYNHPPYAAGYWAPDRRYFPDGSFEAICTFIPHTMSTECRFDQVIEPARCEGCIHEGSQYVKTMSEMK